MPGIILLLILGVLLVGGIGLWFSGERGKIVRPSTLEWLRAGGLRNLINFNFLHGYFYMRWTNLYVDVLINHIIPRLPEKITNFYSQRYHGKVLTEAEAEAIVRLDHDMGLRDLEQVIPYSTARGLVLKGPPDIAVYECACRHSRQHPCQPTQVCMVMGQPFVNLLLEHHPQTSRRLDQDEALRLLQEENERGHLHTAWFKDVLLDRFYVICNCCKCCCAGVEAMVKYGIPALASSGYVAQVDEALCNACGSCAEACPFGALAMEDIPVVNWEKCMGCGVCASLCPSEGIALVRDEHKGIPLDIRTMS